MKKNYLLICACTIAAFAFAGCGSNAGPEPSPSPEVASTEAAPSEPAAQESAAPSAKPSEDNFTAPHIELPQLEPIKAGDQIATIVTDMGEIKLRLFPEYAPKAVENFVTHAKNGYYDGVIFHRVIENFMAQTGDPDGTGMGGESIWGEDFEDEVTPNLHNIRGAVSMANAGANTNGSQFFIVQNKEISDNEKQLFESSKEDMDQVIGEDAAGTTVHLSEMYPEAILDEYINNGGTYYLDFVHTVFGQVYEGMDVVDAIVAVEKDENDKPVQDIHIQKIEIGEYK